MLLRACLSLVSRRTADIRSMGMFRFSIPRGYGCRPVNDTAAPATALSDAVGARVAAYLRANYPKDAEKLIARDLNVAGQTSRGWLSGQCPQNRHLFAMMERWGKPFIAEILKPIDTDSATLLTVGAELDRLNAAHQRVGTALAALAPRRAAE